MEQLQTLTTLRGRSILRSIYRELRYERQLGNLAVLNTSWRICASERELNRYSGQNVTVLHPLGFFGGTALWLQEIVNRFYFSTISSLVYLGAAFLLVIVGAFRFTNAIGSELVVAGIALEALLLTILFITMFFSPPDDVENEEEPGSKDEESESRQLIREIGEISSDYAAFSVQVEEITATLASLAAQQDELIGALRESSRQHALMVAPQPELLETIRKTNASLGEFQQSIADLVAATQKLQHEKIEQAVRREVEQLLAGRLGSNSQ